VSQKLLIVLLVVVAVLFVVTIALGASHGPRSSDDDPDGIGFLDGLQGNHFLRLGDKATTTCQTSDSVTLTVPVSPGCALVVEKRSFFSRPTRVAFIPAGSVIVIPDANGVPAKDTAVDGGKCYASAVDHGGGTITVVSAAFASTTIALQTTPCPKS